MRSDEQMCNFFAIVANFYSVFYFNFRGYKINEETNYVPHNTSHVIVISF